jgi:hypothetical protein
VDKTRFIEMLENEPTKFHFLIRPRKFGKSLFLSVLDHYYDIRYKDKFDQLFGDLYIGKNPTPKRNSLFVLNFDFSGIDTSSIEKFDVAIKEKVENQSEMFLRTHDNVIEDTEEQILVLRSKNTVSSYLEFIFSLSQKYKRKVFVIIDEYDHFANDMMASGTYLGENQYKKTVWAGSQVRDFYETLKANSKTVIDKIFITGITPIMLDDLTSGFNISKNLSLQKKYNEILGFTKDEVELIIEKCGIDKSLINNDIEKLYNGYLFNEEATNKLYNSTMIFNYFNEVKDTNGNVKNLIDDNLKTDYGRIKNLINKHDNKQKLRELIENKSITASIINQFSIEYIHEEKNFFSLLYYMGLVTIDNSNPLKVALKIPNYSIKTIYWEFIERMLTEELEGLSLDNSKYTEPIYTLAYDDNYNPFFEYFSKYIVSYLSNRDLSGTVEKDIKFLLLPMFFTSNYYFPISELENSEGYTDIYLKRSHLHPKSVSEWVWEIKYIKQKEAKKKNLIETAKKEAIEQLLRYKNSNLFKDRTDVRYLSVVFIGKKDCLIEEV